MLEQQLDHAIFMEIQPIIGLLSKCWYLTTNKEQSVQKIRYYLPYLTICTKHLALNQAFCKVLITDSTFNSNWLWQTQQNINDFFTTSIITILHKQFSSSLWKLGSFMTRNLLHKHLHTFRYFFQIESILLQSHILARHFIQHIIQLVWIYLYPAVIYRSEEINECIQINRRITEKLIRKNPHRRNFIQDNYNQQRHQIRKASKCKLTMI